MSPRAGQPAGDNAEVVDAPRHRQHGRISEQVLQQRFHLAPRFSAREQGRRTPARSPTPRPPAKHVPAPPRPEPFARPRPLRAGRFATIFHAKHAPSFRLLSAKSGCAQSGTPASLVSAYITIFIARTPEVAARPAAANLIGRHAAAVKRRNPLPACSAAKQARMRKRSSGVRSSDHIPSSPAPSRLRPHQQQPSAFRQAKANAVYSPVPFTLTSPASTLNRQRPERILRRDDARRPQRDGTHKSPNFQLT